MKHLQNKYAALAALCAIAPFAAFAQGVKVDRQNEPVDLVYNALVAATRWSHGRLVALQTGELRWYATSLVFGLVLLLAIMLRNAS